MKFILPMLAIAAFTTGSATAQQLPRLSMSAWRFSTSPAGEWRI